MKNLVKALVIVMAFVACASIEAQRYPAQRALKTKLDHIKEAREKLQQKNENADTSEGEEEQEKPQKSPLADTHL